MIKNIKSLEYFGFDLFIIHNNKNYDCEVTIMKVDNPLGQPMIRVSLRNHPITPDVYIYYMINNIDTLFSYVTEPPKYDVRNFEYEEKKLIGEIIKDALIEKLHLLKINYRDWKPE
jgi:hypothetical protein